MRRSQWVDTCLACAESFGLREDVLGDLHEEMAREQSAAWLCGQLLAIAAHAFQARVREGIRTQLGICCIVFGSGLVGSSVVPLDQLLQAWLVFYYVTGMLSLFAHMASGNRQVTHPKAGD